MSKRGLKAMSIIFFPTLIGSAASGGNPDVFYTLCFLLVIPATIYLFWDELRDSRSRR